jgi:transposase
MSSGVSSLPRDPTGARSERLAADEAQLALGLGDLSALPVEPEPEAATAAGHGQPKPLRPKASRNIGGLPNHLQREDVVIEPESDICPCCQGKLHRIGEDVSETLDIVPAIIRVKRIRRPIYGCRACESAVVQAPAPPWPIDGGLPTAALLAHIAVSKFAWHLPLRDLLLETVMAAGKIFRDDTRLPVLDRSRSETRIGRIWCYALDDRPWNGPAPPVLVNRGHFLTCTKGSSYLGQTQPRGHS